MDKRLVLAGIIAANRWGVTPGVKIWSAPPTREIVTEWAGAEIDGLLGSSYAVQMGREVITLQKWTDGGVVLYLGYGPRSNTLVIVDAP